MATFTANTQYPVLTYANTFGQWVIQTNNLVQYVNNFSANGFIKPTGTLRLSEPTTGLQVDYNAIIGGQLQVTGVGSSAT